MKLKANLSPLLLQGLESAAQSFTNRSALVLILLSLLGGGVFSIAHAKDQDPVKTIRDFAKQPGLTAEAYANEVKTLVKAFPDKAEDIIAEAVKDQPTYACEVIKAGISALPLINGNPDPKLVASIVLAVLRSVQTTDPDFIDNIRDCAVAADNAATAEITAAISNFLADVSKKGRENSEQDDPAHSHPSPTPKQVTPFQNQ